MASPDDDKAERQAVFVARLQRFSAYIQKAVWVDTLSITAPAPGQLRVEASWKEGHFVKDYEVACLPRLCRTRRGIISDLLDARKPLED